MFEKYLSFVYKPLIVLLLIGMVAQYFLNKTEVAMLNSSITTLSAQLHESETRLMASTLNEATLENQIDSINLRVERERVETKRRSAAYAKAMSKKAVNDYIQNYIKDINNEKSECDNLNSILDNVISIGL